MERLAHSAFAHVRDSGVGPSRMREPQYNSARNGERAPPHLWHVYRSKTYKDDNEFLCFSGESRSFEEWMQSFAFRPESVYIAYPSPGTRLTLIQFLKVFEPVLHIRTGDKPKPPKVDDFSKLARTDAEKALQLDLNGLVIRVNAAVVDSGLLSDRGRFASKRMRFGATDESATDADHEPPLPDTVPAQIREAREAREAENDEFEAEILDFGPPPPNQSKSEIEQAVARVVDARLRPYVDFFYDVLQRVVDKSNHTKAAAIVEPNVERKIETNKEAERLNSIVQRVRDVVGYVKNEIRRRYVTLVIDRMRRAESSAAKTQEEANRYARALEVFEARARDKNALTRAVGAVVRAHMRVGAVDDPPAPAPAPPPAIRPLAPPPTRPFPTHPVPVQPFIRATTGHLGSDSDSDKENVDPTSSEEEDPTDDEDPTQDEDTSGDENTTGDEEDDDKENADGNVSSILETLDPTGAPSVLETAPSVLETTQPTRTLVEDTEAMFMPSMPRRKAI